MIDVFPSHSLAKFHCFSECQQKQFFFSFYPFGDFISGWWRMEEGEGAKKGAFILSHWTKSLKQIWPKGEQFKRWITRRQLTNHRLSRGSKVPNALAKQKHRFLCENALNCYGYVYMCRDMSRRRSITLISQPVSQPVYVNRSPANTKISCEVQQENGIWLAHKCVPPKPVATTTISHPCIFSFSRRLRDIWQLLWPPKCLSR